MATQVLPARSQSHEAHERTPLLQSAKLPAQGHQQANASPKFNSPMVAVSEAESFEIVMGEQSPMQSFTNKLASSEKEATQHTRSILEALDKPLEEPFTRCRWGTGCVDMTCTFAHPSPSLQSKWGVNGDLPKMKKECPDHILCSNPGESGSDLLATSPPTV